MLTAAVVCSFCVARQARLRASPFPCSAAAVGCSRPIGHPLGGLRVSRAWWLGQNAHPVRPATRWTPREAPECGGLTRIFYPGSTFPRIPPFLILTEAVSPGDQLRAFCLPRVLNPLSCAHV